VRSLRAQLEQADARLEQAERRSRAAAARQKGGGLLSEEELYHEAEALRDEITVERQRRYVLMVRACVTLLLLLLQLYCLVCC
jgi:hypothetical protein